MPLQAPSEALNVKSTIITYDIIDGPFWSDVSMYRSESKAMLGIQSGMVLFLACGHSVLNSG